jgi:hypothetical protein
MTQCSSSVQACKLLLSQPVINMQSVLNNLPILDLTCTAVHSFAFAYVTPQVQPVTRQTE